MRVVWQCEANPYRREGLRRNWPDVPCYEDVHTVVGDEEVWSGVRSLEAGSNAREGGCRTQRDPDVDLLCGGFPCQDLSVAGRRAGLKGERSSLFFEFARIADALRPRW